MNPISPKPRALRLEVGVGTRGELNKPTSAVKERGTEHVRHRLARGDPAHEENITDQNKSPFLVGTWAGA